jgi:ABC-type lipoprotein export system ATPase subunit
VTPRSAGAPIPVDPLIEVINLTKEYGAPSPLRINQLRLSSCDRVVLSGLDPEAAETLMHLLTGASLPDAGEIRIEGRSTAEISTDTEWLASLDRFGMVSDRAVLFESLPTAASLALPFSLAIEPMPDDVRRQVEVLAADAGIERSRIDVPVSELAPAERLRVHLARAVAHRPQMVLLELPTSKIPGGAESQTFGELLHAVSAAQGFGWLAVSDDREFARASGGRHVELRRSGTFVSGRWRRWGWLRSS